MCLKKSAKNYNTLTFSIVGKHIPASLFCNFCCPTTNGRTNFTYIDCDCFKKCAKKALNLLVCTSNTFTRFGVSKRMPGFLL